MAIKLQIDNRFVRIQGADRKTIRRLEEVTSYLVAGFMFSPAWRARRWDGREHLLKFSTAFGYRVPIGLLLDIVKALRKAGVEYELDTSARKLPTPLSVAVGWNESVVLRGYQREAIDAICADGLTKGSGILKMPIRSGKTKTAAGIIHRLGVRTLFIVPSQMLLYQTRDALRETLQADIGMIGDSEWEERDITVATIQTLAKARGGERVDKKTNAVKKIPMDPRYKELTRSFGLIIFDECHHLRGDVWHAAMMDFDALYRIGLSATAYLDNERENERGVIWLKACCGRIRIDIPTSRLIDEGYLMKQNVELHVIEHPDLSGRRWSQSLHNEGIYENEVRNRKIAELAKEKVEAGMRVLIVSNRLNQIALIQQLLDNAGLMYETVVGQSEAEERQDKVAAFREGEAQVLLGTVFGEGIDIPEVECVINAEGGRDIKATVQRMRNLTPHDGKVRAVFIDFMDMTNSYFAAHSRDRLVTYRSEPAFDVKIIKAT